MLVTMLNSFALARTLSQSLSHIRTLSRSFNHSRVVSHSLARTINCSCAVTRSLSRTFNLARTHSFPLAIFGQLLSALAPHTLRPEGRGDDSRDDMYTERDEVFNRGKGNVHVE